MNTLLRSLIVWLLMLALPWQGLAAAAMVACAPAHGGPKAAHMAHMAQIQVHHDAVRPPCHEATIEKVAAVDDEPAQEAHAGAAKCANCAACGIAAMLPASFPPHAQALPPLVSTASGDSAPPTVHLAQPERPPRTRLA